ncbi:ParB/RepB/Spo0J family partition protein [Alkalicoccus urumqiensis]|uniref:Chromosome partitioning protein ParB n=1 Tax=Alkalicoccus urumqiensis TaxID=1548213 RepID=A0A2P6MDJ9_ALKUR|nr:ParB/RepB/Spo0J family partition protein [Alkalicoccus urumqiensis]PRO64352.1 chromosome partitioning protein ParB [Alkalicoccus urumqiensis]
MAKGLGRGINAFFPDADDTAEDRIEEVAVKDLRPNPYQPRKIFDDEAIQELAVSIQKQGLIQPITVRPSVKGYEIVVGERRFRAAREAGLKRIPAVIKELNDDEMMELALIENLQREDLNVLEEARAYQKLMEHLQLNQTELAARLGKSRPHIANYLRLLKLPELVQDYVNAGTISSGHARALLGLKNERELSGLLQRIVKEEMSVRRLEELIQRLNDGVSRETKKEKSVPAAIRRRESRLKSYLGTNVHIRTGKKKGRIEIDYADESELERLLEMLVHEEE